MRILRGTLLAAVLLLLTVARPVQAVTPQQEAPLDPDTLANLTYPAEGTEVGELTLTDGEFMYMGDDYQLSLTLRPEHTAYGDLDGDGDTDAAVVTVLSGGGSGQFYYLNAVLDEDGEAAVASFTLLGDRIGIFGTSIDESGAIVVETVTHGPHDALCCPTLRVERTYRLDGETLALESEVEIEAGDESAADPLAAWDPEAAPRTATLNLGGGEGEWLDPMLVSVMSGTPTSAERVDASRLGTECAGVVPTVPDVVVEWTADPGVEQLRFFVESMGDPALVVVTPDGEIVCNDDLNPLMLDPMVAVDDPAEGRYAVYVGAFEDQAVFPGFLVVTGLETDPATFQLSDLMAGRAVDPRAVPLTLPADTLSPEAGPEPVEVTAEDVPATFDITAGGAVAAFDVDLDNSLCTGFVTAEPTLRFTWAGEVEKLTLFVEAEQDTTLIVRDPNGTWQCADDADGAANLNPWNFLTPIPGEYGVWVGSFAPDVLIDGVLTIGGDPSVRPAPLTNE